MLPPYILVAVGIVVICILRNYAHGRGAHGVRNAPGPRPLPLIGNVHQLPFDYQWRTFTEWGKIYGDVVHAKLFQTRVLVLNSFSAAQDLLQKRAEKYSGRPRFVLISELMGWDAAVTHMDYGERFRRHRRWMHDAFLSRRSLMKYRPLQIRETYRLLNGLTETPESFPEHIRRFNAAIMMEAAYGHTVKTLDDEFVRFAQGALSATVEAGSPGSMLVDFFPILKYLPTWLPGAGFKRKALAIAELVREMFDVPYTRVRERMAAGTASPSFTASLVEDYLSRDSLTREVEEDIKGAAGVLYGAGTDTTITVMTTFILAMLLHPDCYKKAQKEMDKVIGSDRLPDLDDRPNLPYLDCVIKEVLRWNCPVPLGVPHKNIGDDEYSGFHVQDGTMIIPNLWAMSKDEDVYPDSEQFLPERFFGLDAETTERIDPRKFVFGFGRRVCPGQDFADSSLWLVAANLVATMYIIKARDHKGKEITPVPEFISGFVSHPKSFKCDFRPRSGKAAEVISRMSINVAP